MWQKVGSIDERAVVQVQLVRSKTLRPLWSSPSISLNERKEGDTVVLDSFIPALAFVSVPMLSKGHTKLQEEKLAAGLSSQQTTANAASPSSESTSEPAEKKEESAAENEVKKVELDSTTVSASKAKAPLITEVDELD